MKTKSRRACQVCGAPLSGESDFCPVCALRGALGHGQAKSEPSVEPILSPWQLRFEHYEVLTRADRKPFELGRGAMGVTYKAIDVNLRCPVALKIINARLIGDESVRRRFVREARAAASVRHSNVASVFHLGASGDSYFYAMEFIEGEPLDEIIRRSGRLEPKLALEIMVQVASGLSAVHKQNLVHRDIKPSNIMVSSEGNVVTAKIIDLGLAKAAAESQAETAISMPGSFAGTPGFASPEQFAGVGVDIRSDLYSLGVTLWNMLAGQPPFGGTSAELMHQHLHAALPIAQLEHFPQPFVTLIEVLLEKDPARRFQNPTELLTAVPTVTAAIGARRRITRQILLQPLSADSRVGTRAARTRLGPKKMHPDATADFSPLKSRNTFPNNLPVQLTSFIGRQAEVKGAKDLLMRENVRLVTLTGPGGMGKTRLALQAAADLIDRFEDGVFFVDLAPIREPEFVLSAVARTVGLRESSDRPLLDELKGQLRAQMLLLLLDNFEQVRAAAPKVGELLRDCPQLKLLVTSREVLHVRGEHVFPVPPLALPKGDLKQPSLEQLTQCEAIRLFIERAQAVKPDFELTNETASAVAEICLRLDGLPLAIELATARISLFSPLALLERLGSRLKLLRGGARDLPVRQRTLRDTIDWNYELLDSGEQRLFALLSVFPSCTFEAVEVVASGIKRLNETGVDILDGLASLVDKSLIRRADEGTGEPRLLMLETIREYAAERLEEDREFGAAARRAHASYYADFTRRQWERLTGEGREAALGEMERDIENLQAAWHYWVAERDLEQLRKLADCLWLLYDARGWYHAMVDSTGDLLNVLASTPSTPERAQQEIMLRISLARALMAIKGCTPEVEKAYTGALDLCHGEIPQLFPVLRGLASYYIYVGDFEKGARMGEQILSLAERHDDASMRVEGHLVLGYNLAFLRSLSLGLDHLEKGITNYHPDQSRSHRFRLGNNPGVACFTTSALVLWMLGFPDRALKRANDAVALASTLNHPFSTAYALFHTGLLHLWRREVERVQGRAQAVLDITEKHEFQIWRAVATCLHGAALAGMGLAEEGLMQNNRGMDLYQGLKTPPVFWPMLLLIRAGVCGQAGRPEEGLASLDEALKIVGQGSGNPLASEFCRLKGDLLLALSPENLTGAEPWFQQALQIAQERQARMLELRAAMSLGRLWREQGKAEHGRQLLRDAYERLTEGFTTADLKEASALLADLS